jgi:hypothetical protein
MFCPADTGHFSFMQYCYCYFVTFNWHHLTLPHPSPCLLVEGEAARRESPPVQVEGQGGDGVSQQSDNILVSL